MKNKNGIYSTLFVLFSAALLWMGCSSQNGYYYDNGSGTSWNGPHYGSQQVVPYGQPSPAYNQTNYGQPAYGLKEASRDQNNSSYIENCGVRVTAKQPQTCLQGDDYVMDVEVQALRDVCEVVVHAMLPEGVSLIQSTPEGIVNNQRQITWNIDGLKKGECINNRLTLRSNCEGNTCICFCATAIPVQFCSTLCTKPKISCSKVGPCEVSPGDPVTYCITVTNNGSCAALDVVVTDQVPPELEHASGQRTLTFRLGSIEPCQTKKFNVCYKAVKRGQACNTIVVTSSNATQCQDTFCTLITQYGIDLQKNGPQEVKIGGIATYDIVVTNTGDKPLTDVIVQDNSPAGTSIIDAKGGLVNGNQVNWRIKLLNPGERQVFNTTLTSCTTGYCVNKAAVQTCQGLSAKAEFGTRWRGTPGLNVQIVDLEGPICVGDGTAYFIRVINQGSEEDQNVSVIARFPKEIMPVAVYGATNGRISGGTVTFTPANTLGPRQTLEYRIDACAREPGDARIKVEVSSDTFKTPITQEESTIVN